MQQQPPHTNSPTPPKPKPTFSRGCLLCQLSFADWAPWYRYDQLLIILEVAFNTSVVVFAVAGLNVEQAKVSPEVVDLSNKDQELHQHKVGARLSSSETWNG